jgi:hypothetical protein
MNKRLEEIFNQIEKLEKERDQIRKDCHHTHYHIANYMWRIAHTMTLRICTECGETLGSPTKQELSQFKEEGNNGIGYKVYENQYDEVDDYTGESIHYDNEEKIDENGYRTFISLRNKKK